MKRQFGLLALARLAATAVQAITLIILARLIEVEHFGALSAVLAAQMTILSVLNLGIVPFALREYAQGRFERVSAAFRLNIWTSLLAAGVAASVPFLFFANSEFVFAFVVLALSVTLDKHVETTLTVPIATRAHFVTILSILIRPLFSAATFVAFYTMGTEPVLAFTIGRLAASISGEVVALIFIRVPSSDIRIGQLSILRMVGPLAASNAIGALRSLDIFIVSIFAGPLSSGLYSAASKTLAPVTVVAGAMSAVLMPTSTKLSPSSARSEISKLCRIAFLATLVTIIPAVFSVEIIQFIFGSDYEAAGGAFFWILLSIPAAAAAPMIATIMQAQRQDRFVVVNTTIFTPLTLIGAAIGAFLAGATGAGLSFAIFTWLRVFGLFAGSRRLL